MTSAVTIYLLTRWSMTTTEKTCFKCHQKKLLSDFYKHSAMADGHLNKCKECTKKDVHEHRYGKYRDYVLEYDKVRSRTWIRKEKSKRIIARWMLEHPDRRAAQIAVSNAVRSKKITPLPCWCCGEKAEAHHADYSDQLGVMWLCPAHHKQAHALGRKLEKGINK